MTPVQHTQQQLLRTKFLARGTRGNFINGQECEPHSGKYLPVVDPASELQVCLAPDSDATDVHAAVVSARQAFDDSIWSRMRPAERERLLYQLSLLIEQHGAELSGLETLQSGKLQAIAQAVDVQGGAECVRYMAGWATKLEGQTLQPSIVGAAGAQFHTWTRREPLGVVAAVVPWNFSLAIALWKVAPALATGCTVVLKPAPETPLTALRLAELALQAGFPPGVLNVVCGGAHTGAALVGHAGINKISFTGSTATGQAIGQLALAHLTRTTLELGGKSPLIVLEDADVQQAAFGAAMGIFFNQGQVCTAGSRVYVQRRHFDAVTHEMARIAESLKIGSGFDPQVQLGPVVSERHFERVMGHLEGARQQGATVLTGGGRSGSAGYFVQPTVLVNTAPDMRVVQEEVFGPVVVAVPFDTVDEVVQLANASPFGLAASIWSNNLAQVHRLIPRLQAGTVWVNCHNLLDNNLPLGGYKQSGVGKDLGRAAVESYTELKSVCMAV
jgi:phenylacetaldehyde dehydrogenase